MDPWVEVGGCPLLVKSRNLTLSGGWCEASQPRKMSGAAMVDCV